jgi:CRP-like cAMP-binding protein
MPHRRRFDSRVLLRKHLLWRMSQLPLGCTSVLTTLSQFKKGDVLFRQGDASDRVLRVTSGEIEVLREVGEASIVLGNVRQGEWLGEMGVIENRNRSATARAASDGAVEILTAQQFLDRMTNDPRLAREVILRLSIRLRKIEDKIAEGLPPEHALDSIEGTTSEEVIPENVTISLVAQTGALYGIRLAPHQFRSLPCRMWLAAARSRAKPNQHDTPIY